MRAVDLMTPLPEVVLTYDPLFKVAEIMRDHDVGMVPVVNDRESMRVVGVITDRDIVLRHVASGHHYECPAEDAMTREPLFSVEPDEDLETVMTMMRTQKVRRILVVSPSGRLLGIISQADLVLHAGPEYPLAVERVISAISEPLILQR
ncbi:MAG TPA: CBS domain-containing protein [Longimicrobiales bacterium]|nr:CBS domain-containing protein [Longimicrobiales bacterium]